MTTSRIPATTRLGHPADNPLRIRHYPPPFRIVRVISPNGLLVIVMYRSSGMAWSRGSRMPVLVGGEHRQEARHAEHRMELGQIARALR